MKKKIISLLLAFMMLAMVSLSVPAQAAEIERSEYITTADTASETVGSSREDITAHSKDVQEGTKTDTMVENTSPFNEYPDNISNTSGNYITENIVSAGFPLEPDEDAIENPVMTPENQAQLNAYKKKLLSEIKEDGYALNRSALSLFSASNIPTFNQYLADYNYHFNCYDFYKNEFKMPYRSYVETRKDDPVYQGLLAAWRIATFELSDAAKYSNKEIGFYETILYDVLYQGQDMESLSGSLAKYVKSVQPY